MVSLDKDMEPENQTDKIVVHLEALNKKISKQLSIRFILFTGIIYGIGFFIGSAILATIVLGIVGPTIAEKVGWVKASYDAGSSILRGNTK